MISVVIIEQLRRQEQEKTENQRPVLHIDQGPREPHPNLPEHKSAQEESTRGVAIIDFSI